MKFFIRLLVTSTSILILFCCSIQQPISKFTKEELLQLDSCDQNNRVYPVGTNLIFDYYIINKNQNTTKVLLQNDMHYLSASSWDLVNPDTVKNTDFLIDKIQITVLPKCLYNNSEYAQTQIQFDYLKTNDSSMLTLWSGIVEDKDGIWWHPPRATYFFSTEFAPFPEITFPIRKGRKWKQTISAGYNTEIKEWVGEFDGKSVIINSTYKITGKTNIQTAFGELECYIVEAEGISPVSKATLTAYYHPTMGFVKWNYHNLDGTNLVINLISKTHKNPLTK